MGSIGGSGSDGSANAVAVNPGHAAGVIGKIESVTASITTIIAEMEQLNEQIKSLSDQLRDAKKNPPKRGKDESSAAYVQRINSWNEKVSSLLGQLDGLNNKLQSVQGKLQQKTRDLRSLEAELPRANDADRRAVEKQLEDARKAQESLAESVEELVQEAKGADPSGKLEHLRAIRHEQEDATLVSLFVPQVADGPKQGTQNLLGKTGAPPASGLPVDDDLATTGA